MKIINTTELANLPEGIIFSDYEPCVLGDLKIKGETINQEINQKIISKEIIKRKRSIWSQWYEAYLNDIEGNKEGKHFSLKEGDSSPLDVTYCKDVYLENQLWAVWEKEDLLKLSEIINEAIVVTDKYIETKKTDLKNKQQKLRLKFFYILSLFPFFSY